MALDTPRKLAALMVAIVMAVGGLAFWDANRESAAALDDFAQEQATLAASVASSLAARLAAAGGEGRTIPADLLPGLGRIERPNAVALFVAPPGEGWRSTDGRPIATPELRDAFASGRSTVRIPGPEAARLGLPERTALAGLSRVNAGSRGTWGVAVVASAERERDRERRAQARLVLAIAVAAGIVVGFGGLALRKQRKELELEHELKVAQLARERDERLARVSKAATMVTLASGVAHELSTPLGVIAGRAEQLLERVAGDERSERSLRAILDQSERMRDVIRGLLDVAQGGRPVLQEVAPAAVVREAVGLVAHRFEKAGVELRTRVPPALPPLWCEPRLLEHALVNLLLNACDASAPGRAVEVSVEPEGGGVAFTVTDDGEGIAPAVAERAAEPFFTTKPRGKGTGLGLAIANEIAKTHRGSLSLAPGSPRGTRACIHIPRAQGEAHA